MADMYSREWQEKDVDGVSESFIRAGFRNTEQILVTRLFDLLNIDRLDIGKAEEMLLALYRWYSEDPAADEEMALGMRRQEFSYNAWRKRHMKLSEVTAGDIVLAESVNKKAVLHLFGLVVRAFYKSDEYDRNEYRYSDLDDLIITKYCK